ncbi:MAG: class I tRNA ligase family protein [Desulfobacterales bacterium]
MVSQFPADCHRHQGRAPYKTVLTHGFVVDGNGKKMSKSIGNVIALQKVIDRYGAETWWLWFRASITRMISVFRKIF